MLSASLSTGCPEVQDWLSAPVSPECAGHPVTCHPGGETGSKTLGLGSDPSAGPEGSGHAPYLAAVCSPAE